jgi:O-palmitoleoyl-L-serine hydrolase
MYCDGGSWTGNISEPISAPPKAGAANVTIYYRGRRLLDALIDHLLEPVQGLASATDLLFGGCSAGGLTAYAHADYVASRMPRTVNTLAIADAMFALNSNSYLNTPLFPARMQWGYKAWDSGPSLNQDCVKALGGVDGSDGWKCMFGGVAAGFVKTPLFVINSKYDTWQEKAIIGANVTITSPSIPPAAKAFWVDYGDTMVEMLEALPTQHGYFVSNCPAHCQTGTTSSWTGMSIGGIIMGEAFVAWHQAHSLPTAGVGVGPAATGASASSGATATVSASTRAVEHCAVTTCGSDACHTKDGDIVVADVDPYLASMQL